MSSKDLIITLPNERLHDKSHRVTVISDDLLKVIKDMKAATLDWEAGRAHEVGVALAAIQIGQPYQIIIVRNDFDNKDDKSFSVFINPQIVKKEGEIKEDYEGCLSVKDIYGKVPRYAKIRMRALDEQGWQVRVRAEGFLARVIQHEIDHIKGLVFVDHIKDQPEAFFKLEASGKLTPVPYEQIKKTGIFR